MHRSYNYSSLENAKPSESVPERTIFIPLLAYISENKEAPSMKSSINVTSSKNTYLYPFFSNYLKSSSISDKESLDVT